MKGKGGIIDCPEVGRIGVEGHPGENQIVAFIKIMFICEFDFIENVEFQIGV